MGEEQEQKQQSDKKPEPDAGDPSHPQPKPAEDDPSGGDKTKQAEPGEAPPPPPEEIVMRVLMHCAGCARKVQRCLRACEGVEEVSTDCRGHRVVVKGKADAAKVAERLQRKTGRRVELLTPLPPAASKEEKPKAEEPPPPPPEAAANKREHPPAVAVVLKVHMHCEACAQELKKRILKMKGVQSAEADLKASQVTVAGVFEAAALVGYVYRRTGKHAAVVRQEVVAEKKKQEGGAGEGGKEAAQGEEEAAAARKEEEEMVMMQLQQQQQYYYYQQQLGYGYPRYHHDEEQVEYAYPPSSSPQPLMFSDDNPNACTVM